MTADPHAGRPTAPEYRERGLRLMAEWSTERRSDIRDVPMRLERMGFGK